MKSQVRYNAPWIGFIMVGLLLGALSTSSLALEPKRWRLEVVGSWSVYAPADYKAHGSHDFLIGENGLIEAESHAYVISPEWLVPNKVRVVSAANNWWQRRLRLTGKRQAGMLHLREDWVSEDADLVVENHFSPGSKLPMKVTHFLAPVGLGKHDITIALVNGQKVHWNPHPGVQFTYTLKIPKNYCFPNTGEEDANDLSSNTAQIQFAQHKQAAKDYIIKNHEKALLDELARLYKIDKNSIPKEIFGVAYWSIENATALNAKGWETLIRSPDFSDCKHARGCTLGTTICMKGGLDDEGFGAATSFREAFIHEGLHSLIHALADANNKVVTSEEQEHNFINQYLKSHPL